MAQETVRGQAAVKSRSELADAYLESLPYAPYPVQEDALLAWFTCEQGVLVCAPTGTGKTLIAQAALYEALHTNTIAYYTTPLIALTEQKFREIQQQAEAWGFKAEDVGLVTGNRRVNPNAKVLVVVAEILLNRLLNPEDNHFDQVSGVVMDEFHSFADPERGIVWELSLALLPPHVRLMLLSATVGNANEFVWWLQKCHNRRVELVQGHERRVPLNYNWVPDKLLNEFIEEMAQGTGEARRTPALLFCFNRDECWTVAEQLKGLDLLTGEERKRVDARVEELTWTQGVGPKMRQLLRRGVGVHHAGMLPKYRRVVEELYLDKLLAVCVCTETLAAGMNLPARSVVLNTLLKGPRGNKKVIEASSAHQIFGRAGRPQFDHQGFVFALAHEDDVKILRWKQKYDSIPEDTKDPGLLKAKKALKKKKPSRRDTEQYWNDAQFEKLQQAPPSKLYSKGPIPWRLLAYLLQNDPDLERVRQVIHKRLMDAPRIEAQLKLLDRMLVALAMHQFVDLEPPPPAGLLINPSQAEGEVIPPFQALTGSLPTTQEANGTNTTASAGKSDSVQRSADEEDAFGFGLFEDADLDWGDGEPETPAPVAATDSSAAASPASGLFSNIGLTSVDKVIQEREAVERARQAAAAAKVVADPLANYQPTLAKPTPALAQILLFRSIHPIYGSYLLRFLGMADREERIQALEMALEFPRNMTRSVRVPGPNQLPQGPLGQHLEPILLKWGLIKPQVEEEEKAELAEEREEQVQEYHPPVGRLLQLHFEATHPFVNDALLTPIWCIGELLRFDGDFNKYVRTYDLTKQEGIIFRHVLRFILLLSEFAAVTPDGMTSEAWQAELRDLAARLTASCREVDPESTDKLVEEVKGDDVHQQETHGRLTRVYFPELATAGLPVPKPLTETFTEEDEARWSQLDLSNAQDIDPFEQNSDPA